VLADLSVNHVERHILLRGFAVNRMTSDYGIDLVMRTYTDNGEVESGQVLFQVKATDSLQVLQDEQTIVIRIEVADLKAWHDEWVPVVLVVYDGQRDRAYWLYVQKYLNEKQVSGDDLAAEQDRVTLRIPRKNRLNRQAIEQIRLCRLQHENLMRKGGHFGH
jgi:hypothetical protein